MELLGEGEGESLPRVPHPALPARMRRPGPSGARRHTGPAASPRRAVRVVSRDRIGRAQQAQRSDCHRPARPPRRRHPNRWRGRRVRVQQRHGASSVAAQLGDQTLHCLPPPRRPRRLPAARPSGTSWPPPCSPPAYRCRWSPSGSATPAPPPPSTSTPTPCQGATGPPSTSWPNSSPQPPTELPALPRKPAAEGSSRSHGPGAFRADPKPMHLSCSRLQTCSAGTSGRCPTPI